MVYAAHDVNAIHHMKRSPVIMDTNVASDRTFRITNYCPVDIYPAIYTQAGTGPTFGGYVAAPGNTTSFGVSADWQGRIWARTNCTFNDNGTAPAVSGGLNGTGEACLTGDCGGVLNCQGTGKPATLAEFTMSSNLNLSYYDISLVDGYNLPLGIISLHNESSDAQLRAIPSNTTNPVCIGSPNFWETLKSLNNTTVPVNSTIGSVTYSTPLELTLEAHAVSRWCPWPLQIQPPPRPGDGVYPYPDDNIARPDFDPCLSMCSMYGSASYCCTGKYDTAKKCGPNMYSKAAKRVCPDAVFYSL